MHWKEKYQEKHTKNINKNNEFFHGQAPPNDV